MSPRLYYENLIPISPTDDHMELREGSNEDEDFEDCVDEVQEEDQVVPEDKAVIEDYEEAAEDKEKEIVAEHVSTVSSSSSDNISMATPQHSFNQWPWEEANCHTTHPPTVNCQPENCILMKLCLPATTDSAKYKAYQSIIPPPPPTTAADLIDQSNLCSCFSKLNLDQEWLIWHSIMLWKIILVWPLKSS